MIKLIEDIINRRKLNKAQMIMLIYGGVFFLLFGIYLYSQINTFNQRVEYVFNIALNDSVYAIKAYSKSEIKLWVKNDSVLIISPLNPIEKNNAFNLFDQGYNKIYKKEKSSKLVFSNGIDSIPIFLAYPED
jgi:hypothetical protein